MAYIHTAHLVVKPEFVERFKDRIALHARTSLRDEPGCLAFRPHQDRADPTRFLMYEIYADEAAMEAHRASPHFKQFRHDVDSWVVGREWWFWSAIDTD
jgi:quinol monooxygenase YgiN